VNRDAQAHSAAVAAEQRKAQSDSSLPPLPAFRAIRPTVHETPPREDSIASSDSYDETLRRIVGPPPALAQGVPSSITPTNSAPPRRTQTQLALERRLGGPVLGEAPNHDRPTVASQSGSQVPGLTLANYMLPAGLPAAGASRQDPPAPGASTLEPYLHATPTPAVDARVLPTQRFLLPKGAFVDCTLETAISSSLPGMTTCVTATDTFSSDGMVVLLERGTKLVGETRGIVQAGAPRLFVLWTEARTPAGIVVPLESPGTDELGRAGLTGSIDWHWWQRFGAAMLVTIVDGAVMAAETRSGSTGVQINPTGATDVMTEVLRSTLAIAPTINKPQGDRIEILVARDVDFRPVYQLRAQLAGEP